MSQVASHLLTAFRRVSEALDGLSNEELERLIDPQYTIEIRLVRRRSRDETTLIPEVANLGNSIQTLTDLPSRDEAKRWLEEKFPSKRALEAIARHLDMPVLRQDKLEELRDKIVEATVGARIRSQAIQGTGSGA